jgi:hypothetical protein
MLCTLQVIHECAFVFKPFVSAAAATSYVHRMPASPPIYVIEARDMHTHDAYGRGTCIECMFT